MVIAHGLGGVREWYLDNIAQAFQKAGYACLVFDYRSFGDSDGSPRQIVELNMLLQDWREAIAYARTRTKIDPGRIIQFGTSFSGGHVTKLGTEDNRLAAILAGAQRHRQMPTRRVGPLLTRAGVTMGLRDFRRA